MKRTNPYSPHVREALKHAEKLVKESMNSPKTDSLSQTLRQLYGIFPRESWLARSLARYLLGTVEEQSRHSWLVKGVPELGDKKPFYLVTWAGDKYECTCYNAPFGWSRRKNICTHIAAVILYRRRKYIDEYFS
jgi:hypothetical protein